MIVALGGRKASEFVKENSYILVHEKAVARHAY
jgi:hypothetical protein